MALAAILSAIAPSSDRPEVSRAQIVFASRTLIEYQARQALQAGADQLFIMVTAVTPALSRLVDRLGANGAQIHLIRDMPGLIRQLPRDSDVLLFADGMVADQKYVKELAQQRGNALLVVGDDPTTAHLERVDGLHRWAGVARIAPQTLFNTLDLIGDWDLVLTLLRAVVQSEPRRIAVDPSDIGEGRVVLVDRQDIADLAGKSLASARSSANAGAGAERYLLQVPARLVAMQLLRMQISAEQIGWGGLVIAGLGLLSIIVGWVVIPLLLFLLALAVDMVARQLSAMGQQSDPGLFADLAPTAIVSAGFIWLGIRNGVVPDGLHLGLICLMTAFALRRGLARSFPYWALMTPGSAVIILLVGAISQKFAAAMALTALLAVLSIGAMLLMERPGASPSPRP